MYTDPLRSELIEIARELQPCDIKLIVGGGYGLLLRTEHILNTQARTRFDETPIARSTEDIDIFLNAEIITSREKTELIRDAILNAGFEPITKHFQFGKRLLLGKIPMELKIDLLAAPASVSESPLLEMNSLPRVRPKGAKKVHAYLTKEAVTIDEELSSIEISTDSTPLQVLVPHPFSYLILKLFAYRDRKGDSKKGPYHAVDIYRIIGMMTELEWEAALAIAARYADDPIVREAASIVSDMFSHPEAEGVIQIRRYLRSNDLDEDNVAILIEDLKAVFQMKSESSISDRA